MYDTQESRDEAAASMQMDSDQFDSAMERGDLDDKYADYLMFRTDALIGNGEMLLAAMESGRYYDSFKDSYLGEKK